MQIHVIIGIVHHCSYSALLVDIRDKVEECVS